MGRSAGSISPDMFVLGQCQHSPPAELPPKPVKISWLSRFLRITWRECSASRRAAPALHRWPNATGGLPRTCHEAPRCAGALLPTFKVSRVLGQDLVAGFGYRNHVADHRAADTG